MLRANRGIEIFLLSVVIAMALRVVPLPNTVVIYNPDWVALVIIFWCINIPDRFGVGWAWTVGLLTDVLTGRLLGQYALSYCIIAFICIRLHRRMRVYPITQQMIAVFVLLGLCQLLIYWTENVRGATSPLWSYSASSISGAMVWPLVYILMRRHR